MKTRTVGIDLGDRYSNYCVLDEDGKAIDQGRVSMTQATVEKVARKWPAGEIALEVGTHSRWVAELLETLGQKVIIAEPSPRRSPLRTVCSFAIAWLSNPPAGCKSSSLIKREP